MGEVHIRLKELESLPVDDETLRKLCGHWEDHLPRVPRLEYWKIPRERRKMGKDDNLCGAQQRAFEIYWAIKECSLKGGVGLGVGTSQCIPPACIGIDKYCGVNPNYPDHSGGWGYPTMQLEAENLSVFFDERFHAVIGNHAFEHLRSPVETLKEFHRVLIHGGALVQVIPDVRWVHNWEHDGDHKEPYEPDKFVRYLRETGLDWVVEQLDRLDNGFSFDVIARKGG